jgi:hypothetical protein
LLHFFAFYSFANASGDSLTYSAHFPNTFSELPSPNNMMLLINKDPDENQDSHTLSIRDNSPTQNLKNIYTYNRHVFVGWSPDSKYISITDFQESTNTTCIIYDIQSGSKIDLVKKAMQADESIAKFLQNEHSYLECSNWLSSSCVQIKVTAWGENNPGGVENLYIYDIETGFRK